MYFHFFWHGTIYYLHYFLALCNSLHFKSILFFSLLEQIPTMFGETRETETVLGPVIQAGMEALKVAFIFITFFS